MKEIYFINDLKDLKQFLESHSNPEKLRENLFSEFLLFTNYKNVSEWNKAVRICESLAIIGWDKYEPLEALRGMFFNGNPMTFFLNKYGEFRFLQATWSKRTTGYTIEKERTSYHFSPNQIDKKKTTNSDTIVDIQDMKIESQRNWIPKTPVWFERGIRNCYENSKPFLESVDKELQPLLKEKMQPEKYGDVINRIIISHAHSYGDSTHSKTNYIISDRDKKLSQQEAWVELQKMFSQKEIVENEYHLVNRFIYGPFRSDTGKVNIRIHFEKGFSELSYSKQKEIFTEHVLIALNTTINKLKKKKLDYNFDLMLEHFTKIIKEWKIKS